MNRLRVEGFLVEVTSFRACEQARSKPKRAFDCNIEVSPGCVPAVWAFYAWFGDSSLDHTSL